MEQGLKQPYAFARRYDLRSRKEIIQENLKTLEIATAKKKVAQENYYRNNEGQSPLTRNRRVPVHARLGTNRKKIPPLMGIETKYHFIAKNITKRRKNLASQRLKLLRTQLQNGNFMQFNQRKQFRLQRPNRPQQSLTNYTVQVNNTFARRNQQPQPVYTIRHSLLASLDLTIQRDINELQLQNIRVIHGDLSSVPILKDFGITNRSLNERFSNYN